MENGGRRTRLGACGTLGVTHHLCSPVYKEAEAFSPVAPPTPGTGLLLVPGAERGCRTPAPVLSKRSWGWLLPWAPCGHPAISPASLRSSCSSPGMFPGDWIPLPHAELPPASFFPYHLRSVLSAPDSWLGCACVRTYVCVCTYTPVSAPGEPRATGLAGRGWAVIPPPSQWLSISKETP